jgi:RNA polymerase sigma-70 factor (ECF subfamily)
MGPVDAEVLFAQHRSGLYRYFCRVAGQGDAARDLTQEVFVRAVRASGPATMLRDSRAWLFHIARTVAIDHQRQRQRRPEHEQGAHDVGRPASQEVGAAVNQALDALADLDREVFLMREVAGLGYEEIALACDISPDGVRNRICRARQQLRERLSGAIADRRVHPMVQRPHDTNRTHD